ncbi:heavy metal-binding domain-containing protein [Mycobacterium sp.]|uniref:heavy metal-binding domain-containing protein n=1 Tax=Mycobacterium sp. TaxID=1785 RepID=UPI002C38C33F|nr:heavy metal-binding domain-containing protein [Mycobacterium sp.]HTQ18333.1 heavy metal-binding domain-containing protein [Mycobacterium sp.]
MLISGMSGNEVYCLAQKGLSPGEIVVGNSVCSMGFGGGIARFGQTLAGGEITTVTELISNGRHAAIHRMEEEARGHGAVGVTSVITELRTLAGYTEFLAQGTSVHAQGAGGRARIFSSAASGMELYCHLDVGYQPVRFVMGNIAYALGIGRGITGSLRTFAQGEVHEFSQMYNAIRHHALERLRAEAAAAGANSVVDVIIQMLPYGPSTLELLLTGTASYHASISKGPVSPDQVVTSELTGDEIWNLATLGYAPVQLVMATSVYSLGLAAGIGTRFRSISRGELPQVTKLIYHARENALDLLRGEATRLGAERVIGNKLRIIELAPGLIEIMAIGTAVRRVEGMRPATGALIPQALIIDRDTIETKRTLQETRFAALNVGRAGVQSTSQRGCAITVAVFFIPLLLMIMTIVIRILTRR